MAADGATYDDIVAATGICSNKSSLATILANPIYRGLRVFNRETRAEGEHGRKRRRNPDDQLVISQVEESRPASSPYCRTAGRVGHSLPEGVAPAGRRRPCTSIHWRTHERGERILAQTTPSQTDRRDDSGLSALLQTLNKEVSKAAILPRLSPVAQQDSGARLNAPEAGEANNRDGDGPLTALDDLAMVGGSNGVGPTLCGYSSATRGTRRALPRRRADRSETRNCPTREEWRPHRTGIQPRSVAAGARSRRSQPGRSKWLEAATRSQPGCKDPGKRSTRRAARNGSTRLAGWRSPR